MSTEHQPGSPGVDLDALERRLELDLGSWGNSKKYAAVFAELRTLRARVGELEAYAEDIKTISKRGRKIAELEVRAESAEARVKELEAAADRNANVIYADESVERYRKRITDLESQLAAAREEQELALQVRDWLREECIKLTVAVRPADGRWVADLFDEDDPENFFASVEAETLPALLRAILAVEKGGPDEG